MATTSADHPDLGAAIRRRREELKLRPEDVAAASGLSMTTIRRIEAGQETTIGTLRSIARALRTSTASLLGDDSGEAA